VVSALRDTQTTKNVFLFRKQYCILTEPEHYIAISVLLPIFIIALFIYLLQCILQLVRHKLHCHKNDKIIIIIIVVVIVHT